MANRRGLKPGRHLPPVAAEPLIRVSADLQQLDAQLRESGFAPAATVRPYLRCDRRLTLQFVWRRRQGGWSCTHTTTLRVPVDHELGRMAL